MRPARRSSDSRLSWSTITRRTSIVVEEPADLGRVQVLGQQQRHRAGDARGELELELADAGGDADDHDLAGVDPGLDHAGGAVDDAAVELVPGQRGPATRRAPPTTATSRARSRAWRCSRVSGDSLNRHVRPLRCVGVPPQPR